MLHKLKNQRIAMKSNFSLSLTIIFLLFSHSICQGGAYGNYFLKDKCLIYNEIKDEVYVEEVCSVADLMRLGKCLKKSKNYDLAIITFGAVLKKDSKNIKAYFERAGCWERKGEVGEAMSDYSAVLKQDPNNLLALSSRALLYRVSGEYDLALIDYFSAIELFPQNKYFYTGRAITYSKLGDFKAALMDIGTAEQIDPQNSFIIFNKGKIYENNKDWEAAIKYYSMSLKINAADASSLSSLASIYASCPDVTYRDGSKSLDLIKRAIDVDNNVHSFFSILAAAYAETNDYEKAIVSQQKAIKLAIEPPALSEVLDEYRTLLSIYEKNH